MKMNAMMIAKSKITNVIIKLQNLPWSANAADIRQYFQRLSIPEGGVQIVGGEKGIAFIHFSTDEDARQAMLSDGGCIKNVQIRLFLSSRIEMQKVIETARQQTTQITQVYMHQMQQPQLPLVGSLPPLTAKVLPQPQQQSRPNQSVTVLQRQFSIMDSTAVLMTQDKQQQVQEQSQQHMFPKSTETKHRENKREQIRSTFREHRSRSSSSSGSNRRDRSRSRDRRRGRDRSRDRYHNGGGNKNSSSWGSGSKPHRSRSPVSKAMDVGKGIPDQRPSNRIRNGQYESVQPQTKRFSGENTTGGGGGSDGRHYNPRHHYAVPVAAQPSVAPTGSRSNCVYVHGLPAYVTNTDITQFFAGTSVMPDKIHVVLSKFGRPTGESYCEFSTVQQAHTALIKDQCYMGPNLVHVSPISRSDMIQAIAKPMQRHNHHQDMSWAPGGGGGGPPRRHSMMFGSPWQQHQGPRYGGGGYAHRMRGPGPDGFGQPGCVVALDNVPYCADVKQIVDFFSGFEFNGRNVIRRFNDYGKPTGEVRVNFGNPQEATRAVRVLQNKSIFNRPVRLTLL